jgi:hypothetical protein
MLSADGRAAANAASTQHLTGRLANNRLFFPQCQSPVGSLHSHSRFTLRIRFAPIERSAVHWLTIWTADALPPARTISGRHHSVICSVDATPPWTSKQNRAARCRWPPSGGPRHRRRELLKLAMPLLSSLAVHRENEKRNRARVRGGIPFTSATCAYYGVVGYRQSAPGWAARPPIPNRDVALTVLHSGELPAIERVNQYWRNRLGKQRVESEARALTAKCERLKLLTTTLLAGDDLFAVDDLDRLAVSAACDAAFGSNNYGDY